MTRVDLGRNKVFDQKNLIFKYNNCRHSGPDMESMKAVALAAKARSLADFQKAVKAYKVMCFNS